MYVNWNTGELCRLQKKVDKANCNNFRNIGLLNKDYKDLTSILNERLKAISEANIEEYQCGLRRTSTSDEIFETRQII